MWDLNYKGPVELQKMFDDPDKFGLTFDYYKIVK